MTGAARRAVRPVRVLVVLALAAAVLAGVRTPAVAAPDGAAGAPGIAAGGGIQYLSDAARDAQLDGMSRLGVRWVRVDLKWNDIQLQGPSQWDWAKYDRVVDGIVGRGMKPLAMVAYTPPWARPAGCAADDSGQTCPPASDSDFATFLRTAVSHYAGRVRHWEIWNEPNNRVFWQPSPDAAAYTALLRSATTAIRAADPGAFVVAGGLSPGNDADAPAFVSPVTFLAEMYAAGAQGLFDAAAVHPYTFPSFPARLDPAFTWARMADTKPSMRSVMRDNGDGAKKIWLTEFGAPTKGSRKVSEADQATNVRQAFDLAQGYSWAGPLFVYTWQDTVAPRGVDRTEFSFGLLRVDGSRKPAYAEYRAAAS